MADVFAKPIASGGGMTVSIMLAEPNLFLTGFDHHGRRRGRRSEPGSAFLRGTLKLELSRSVKIKEINLRLNGKGRIDWPGAAGVPIKGRRRDHELLNSLSQELKFFDIASKSWETEYGTLCTFTLASDSHNTLSDVRCLPRPRQNSFLSPDSASTISVSSSSNRSCKEGRRLSLVHRARSRSVGKSETSSTSSQDHVHKDYKRFPAGVYEYTFEIPVDYRYCETVNLPAGYLTWRLSTEIVRPGPFKPNLHGYRDISIIRLPDMMSLEITEPVAIRKCWEDQLYYEMVLSGRTFPIGSRLPIMLKLQPLDKRVQLLKVRVHISESIEYISKYLDPHTGTVVKRKDPKRMFCVFEKVAGHEVDNSRFPGSTLTYRRGGEVDDEARQIHRTVASERGTMPENYDAVHFRNRVSNMLGELDLGLEELWEDTELDLNVQIPTCQMMARKSELQVHPDVSWTRFTVQHWVRVVLRVAKRDDVKPASYKNQYEITIESPIMILNCRNNEMTLPQYSSVDSNGGTTSQPHRQCGCPDAPLTSFPLSTSPLTVPGMSPKTLVVTQVEPISGDNLDLFAGNAAPELEPELELSPPSHGINRVPSYQPRAFTDLTIDTSLDLPTPYDDDINEENGLSRPPQYDVVVGTPSVDGLADYFSRLETYEDNAAHSMDGGGRSCNSAEYDSDDSGDAPLRLVNRGGRVNVRNPMCPVLLRAPSRSMDMQRPALETIMGRPGRLGRR
ncbi:hypothetical protein Cpir12675_004876 [Ceratocystis pirilliformis]|uniref:Arrestin C-terminal-like domain-containing protein n=1 Tax=Ceratocystis pirilliformis TaxID=259994 RepID=A0ABR3YUU2_9PEZI